MLTTERLPRSLDEITPEVVTSVLAVRHPGTEVVGIELYDVTHGSGSRARLRLDYAPGADGGLPTTMWLKSSFNALTEKMEAWQTLEAEARFYDLADTVEVRAPKVYGSAYESAGQCLLLLEDLATVGARFCHSSEPLTRDEAQAILDEMARFHAGLWASPRLDTDFAWFPTAVDGSYSQTFIDMGKLLPRAVRGSRSDLLAGRLIDDELMAEAWQLLVENNVKAPHTLLHYDPHVANTYVDAEGRGGLLDWALARRGLWAHDVNYFLVCAVGIRDRRRWERPLLERYLDNLAAHGVADPPSFDEAWTEYRRQALGGMMAWLFTTPEMQTEEVCRTCISRFAAAMHDHDTLGILTGR